MFALGLWVRPQAQAATGAKVRPQAATGAKPAAYKSL